MTARTHNSTIVKRAATSERGSGRSNERGYTFLFAVFMVALFFVATAIAVPSIITQGKRENEIEMIWRGKQYEKAIGRYTQKFGHNPTKIDDMVKQTNGIRFLRQAYKDPMNNEDGAWRLIYVSGAGALFGSVRYSSLQQMAALDRMAMGGVPGMPAGMPGAGLMGGLGGAMGGPGGVGGAGGVGANGGFGTQNNSPGSSGQNPAGPSGPQGSGGSGFGLGGLGQQSGGNGTNTGFGSSNGQQIGSPLGTTVLGGNIAGVGSKIDKPSLIVYKKADKYKQWEFIYNPYEVQMQAGVQSGGVPGSVPAGQLNPSPFGGQGQGPGGGSSPFGGQPAPPELPQPPSPQPTPQSPPQQ
jgi:hypothetical protein